MSAFACTLARYNELSGTSCGHMCESRMVEGTTLDWISYALHCKVCHSPGPTGHKLEYDNVVWISYILRLFQFLCLQVWQHTASKIDFLFLFLEA